MPRKKTVQPDPDTTFTLADGAIVEIRGPGAYIIGRGLHMQDKHQELCGKITNLVVDIYLSKSGRKTVAEKDDILKSASIFDRYLQNTQLYPISGDDSSVRKRIYRYVKKEIELLAKCIEQKNKS
jgi:hypothetical protein